MSISKKSYVRYKEQHLKKEKLNAEARVQRSCGFFIPEDLQAN